MCSTLVDFADGDHVMWCPEIEHKYCHQVNSCWCHHVETFSALLTLCEGNPPVTGEFPSQRPVMRNFDVCIDLHLNKRLSKQLRRRWFETPTSSLWRHCSMNRIIWMPWWRNQMEAFSALLPRFAQGIHRSPVNSPHKGQWRGALMFSLIYARINGWVNNREAGDLRHPRAHYDVTVMRFRVDFRTSSLVKMFHVRWHAHSRAMVSRRVVICRLMSFSQDILKADIYFKNDIYNIGTYSKVTFL